MVVTADNLHILCSNVRPCSGCANSRRSDAARWTIDYMSNASGYVCFSFHLCVKSALSQFKEPVDASINRDSRIRRFLPGIAVSRLLAFLQVIIFDETSSQSISVCAGYGVPHVAVKCDLESADRLPF